jgi:hypothetical protein
MDRLIVEDLGPVDAAVFAIPPEAEPVNKRETDHDARGRALSQSRFCSWEPEVRDRWEVTGEKREIRVF